MIRLIVAIDRQRGLAKQGFQPWHIPDDEAYFNEKTKEYGGKVLFGRLTYELSLRNKPLSERQNFLLTRDNDAREGIELVHDLGAFLKDYHDQDLWVIGGANVFTQVIEAREADELYITQIEAEFKCTQFFPDYTAAFDLSQESELHEQNGFIYKYQIYKRR